MQDAAPLYLRPVAGDTLMAYRERACQHLMPRRQAQMPQATRLAILAPLMPLLIDCAGAYEDASEDGEYTSAPEFISWLDVEVQRAAHFGAGSPVNAQREAASAANRTPIRLHSTSKKVAP